jgi:hypothetical protein
VKRFVGLVVALSLVPAGTAAAHWDRGALDIKENPAQVKVDGPGFDVKLTKHGLRADIDEERFGIPEAGFPIVRGQQVTNPNLRPIVCENGTYRFVSGTFYTTTRASAPGPRPLPYPPNFGNAFPNIFTFVGTLDAVVSNEAGEQLRLLMSDLAHEEISTRYFTSTNPIHAFIVDERGRIRDRASLVGRVKVDRLTGEAWHNIVDAGTCHQTATSGGQPGVTVFGPFFVLPFPSTVVRR